MFSPSPSQERRRRVLRPAASKGPIMYWMSRDQRIEDNWALAHAQAQAHREGVPMGVVFCLAPTFMEAHPRHYLFMLQGLVELSARTRSLGIPFFLLHGRPPDTLPAFLEEWGASMVVTDFNPLREKREWVRAVMEGCECGLEEVDAHNIIPCWVASPKQEFAAYTLRPKVRLHLNDFLDRAPSPIEPLPWPGEVPEADLQGPMERLGVQEDLRWRGGTRQARSVLNLFLENRLAGYASKRNDPNLGWQSQLSPYLHFGMISALEVALAVMGSSALQEDKGAFLEELIVRRELSDNFCHYNPGYDAVDGFPGWAKDTLRQHLGDRREYLYTQQELERSETHDPLWNAAQAQMVVEGKMHGWLRMYWAKKVLEWTETPEDALRIVNSLNNRYEMDGRDPNGYAGAAWSIGGVHDRAWNERPVFGKVRYMNLKGAYRKFDVDLFVERYSGLI